MDQYPKISDIFALNCQQSQQQLAESLLAEIHTISSQFFPLWNKYTNLLLYEKLHFLGKLKSNSIQQLKERWGESMFREEITSTDLTMPQEGDEGKMHEQIAKTLRRKQYYNQLPGLPIQDVKLFPKANEHPILFDSIYRMKNSKGKKQRTKGVKGGCHIVVLVHGLSGSALDLRSVKNNLVSYLTNSGNAEPVKFLCSSVNEDSTQGNISKMGINLSKEVKGFIKECGQVNRISFIGHSLGGLIIRACLPELEKFQRKMWAFVTLSSPHLGYLYNNSKIINTGLWILNKWKKIESLQQLTMVDAENIQQTCLYNLSKAKGLEWFHNIYLISSYQDQYVPFESARIQQVVQAKIQTEKGKYYKEMVKNLLNREGISEIHRVDVNFFIPDKTLDNMIGRTAHIRFLESESFIKMLIYNLDNIFL